ncbi:MAG: HEAT repeat domain-containing protein [Planctomycetota bacterium]
MDIEKLIAGLDDPAERNDARDALVELGNASVPLLENTLKQRFARFLKRLEKEGYFDARETILQDRDFQFAFFASYILKKVEAPEHIFLDALDAGDPRTRRACAIAIGMLRDVRAVYALTQGLEDKHPQVAMEMAEALRKIGDPAVEGLVEALCKKNADARKHAAAQLGYIGKTAAGKARDLLLSALTQALDDKSSAVRQTANAALYEITGQDFEENSDAARSWTEREE